MLHRLLVALFFISSLTVSGVLGHADTANAWASNDPSPHTRQDYIDFIDARIGDAWRDATGSNYAIFWTSSYPDDFFLIYGHNNTSTSGAFRLNDYGTFTEVQGWQMCRWSGDLSGGAGCNPGGSAGWQADNIYYAFANPDWLADQTNGGAVVGNPTLFAPSTGEKIKPQFRVHVEKKHGDITFRDADESKDYVYAWTLMKFTESEQIGDAEYVTSGVSEPDGVGAFDVDEYGQYVLGVKMCPVGTSVEDEGCSAIAGTGAVWITLQINGGVIDVDTGDDPEESPSLGNCSTEVLAGEEITHCGTFQDGLVATCIKSDFPFIDFPGCVSNVGKIVSMLSFGGIDIGDDFNATPCKTLSVVDDWMHLDNPTICPQIPSYVRSVTTPFVTFALGLFMVSWLSRRAGGSH